MEREDEFLNRPSASCVAARELRTQLSQVLWRVEHGERFIVTIGRRPRAVAQIVPIRKHRNLPLDEALRLAARHADAFANRADMSLEGLRQSTTEDLCGH
jgi:antitoxin (DNA-binding transcriptional repressor) of toxin-antitoxin stability system